MSHGALNYGTVANTQAYGQSSYDQSSYGHTTSDNTQTTTQAFTSQLHDKTEQKNSAATNACIAFTVAALIAAVIALLLLVQGTLFTSGTEKVDAEGTDVPSAPVIQPVFPVLRVMRRFPTVPVPKTQSTVTSTTITPTASTLSPREVIDEQPLICTMGSRSRSAHMFPPDGLCEYIFFDSVEKDSRNPLVDPSRWDNDLLTFFGIHPQYSITAFGIGFSFDKAFSLVRVLNRTGVSLLEPFWRRSIFHFGILNTATINPREPDVDLALRVLKALDTHAQTQRQLGNPSFIFLAGVVFNSNWLNFYSDKFKNFYKPDLFIAQGHYFYGDNTFRDCRVTPPTLLQRQPNRTNYLHDLSMAADSLNLLAAEGVTLISALSVTMKGRFTMTPQGRLLPGGFFSACVHNTSAPSFGSYSEVCRNPRYTQKTYDSSVDAILAFHDREHTMFAYDNEVGLCRKLCNVKAQHPGLRFGIAVYDLDYEDFSDTCASINKYGTFSRFYAIRSVLNYFRTKFRRTQDVQGCRLLIT